MIQKVNKDLMYIKIIKILPKNQIVPNNQAVINQNHQVQIREIIHVNHKK